MGKILTKTWGIILDTGLTAIIVGGAVVVSARAWNTVKDIFGGKKCSKE